jgi:hypothetical protein
MDPIHIRLLLRRKERSDVDSKSMAMWDRFDSLYPRYGDRVFGGAGRAAGVVVQAGTDVK